MVVVAAVTAVAMKAMKAATKATVVAATPAVVVAVTVAVTMAVTVAVILAQQARAAMGLKAALPVGWHLVAEALVGEAVQRDGPRMVERRSLCSRCCECKSNTLIRRRRHRRCHLMHNCTSLHTH